MEDFSYKEEFGNLLPAFSHPLEDELVSSWICRLAMDHFLKAQVFCKIALNNKNVWNRDIDRLAPELLIKRLSELTLTSESRIQQCLVSSYDAILFQDYNAYGFTKWILPIGIYHRQRKRYGLMFCPGCISKDETAYFRKSWRLSLSVVCPKCNMRLHDRCPNCNSIIVFYRRELGSRNEDPVVPLNYCFNCMYDLKKTPIKHITRRYVRMQNHFNSLIKGSKKTYLYSHQYFDVLHQIIKIINGSSDLSKTIRHSLEKKCKIKFIYEDQDFEYLTLEARLPVLYCAYWLLCDWPNRFIGFCKEHRIWSSPLLKDFKNVPFWYKEVVNEHLFVSNINRKFGDLKTIFSYHPDKP